MLDLTVNRMLLNPDTVAKISDIVKEHEDVQLELIFKLGLDGSSKHPGKFHLNLNLLQEIQKMYLFLSVQAS